jgi:arsenate reductase
MSDKKRVLILCTGNSARSQMAEGLLRHDAGDRFDVRSAGTKPSSVRPEAIAVMRELEIDISGQRSKHVSEFDGQDFDYVITVCESARETCPVFFGKARRLHRDFEDPAAFAGSEEQRLAVFRKVRDELRAFLAEFSKQASGLHSDGAEVQFNLCVFYCRVRVVRNRRLPAPGVCAGRRLRNIYGVTLVVEEEIPNSFSILSKMFFCWPLSMAAWASASRSWRTASISTFLRASNCDR